jgi:uncharacterized alpha-E superfamily protein
MASEQATHTYRWQAEQKLSVIKVLELLQIAVQNPMK